MQLRFNERRSRRNPISRIFLIKSILVVFVLFLAIFILDKIDMPAPNKLIKQELSNDKLVTVK